MDGWKIFFRVILALLKLAEGIITNKKQFLEKINGLRYDDALIFIKSFTKETILDEVIKRKKIKFLVQIIQRS